jgi:hypothetical protein
LVLGSLLLFPQPTKRTATISCALNRELITASIMLACRPARLTDTNPRTTRFLERKLVLPRDYLIGLTIRAKPAVANRKWALFAL